MKKTKKKGFTLVELIVVIAIIAILAAVAVPLTITYLDKAEVGATEDEIGLIKGALPLTITEMNTKDAKGVNLTLLQTDFQARMTKPTHIKSLKLKISATGEVTATIEGMKCYNADHAEKKAIADWKVGNISLAVLDGTSLEANGTEYAIVTNGDWA